MCDPPFCLLSPLIHNSPTSDNASRRRLYRGSGEQDGQEQNRSPHRWYLSGMDELPGLYLCSGLPP